MKKWMALAGLAVLAACGPEEEVAKEPGFYNMFAADTLAYRADYKEVPQFLPSPSRWRRLRAEWLRTAQRGVFGPSMTLGICRSCI